MLTFWKGSPSNKCLDNYEYNPACPDQPLFTCQAWTIMGTQVRVTEIA
jgi:hypothetical protein